MQTEQSSKRLINHKVLRFIVGLIAILLSPVVWFLSGSVLELDAISISYWTDSRDIFVGSLIAVGFFMSAYNGSGDGRDAEYYLSKAACVFAICIAFFPTQGFTQSPPPAQWIQAISESVGLVPENIHYTAAVLLFVCLIALMYFFSVSARKKGATARAKFYRGVSVLMVVGIAVIYLVFDSIFWVEVWGLSWFGIGWLKAGSYKNN